VIAGDAQAQEVWAKLSFTHQKEWVRAVEDAKKPETREKRIAALMGELGKRGKK
jgi:uncharacterized protein YdeI (YjbR/CyaY-like superfamily)